MTEFFLEGGWWMYPITLLGCVLVPASIAMLVIGLASPRRNLMIPSILMLVAGLVPAMLGLLASTLNMRASEEAIATVANEADQATIRAAAMAESMTTTLFGLGASVLPVFCGFVLLGVTLSRLPRFQDRG